MFAPEAIVFDLDGTLIDSRGDIVAAVNAALSATGRAPLPAALVVRFVGDGARALLARCAKLAENAPEVDVLVDRFLEHYLAHPVDHTRWMPGAQALLEELAEDGVPIGLCTNKPRPTTDAVLAALGVRTRFRAVCAGGDIPEKKPAPGPLLHVAKLLGVTPNRMIMVGDLPQDIECARRAGCRAIAIEGVFGSADRLNDARPDVQLRTLEELGDVIRRWRDSTVRVR